MKQATDQELLAAVDRMRATEAEKQAHARGDQAQRSERQVRDSRDAAADGAAVMTAAELITRLQGLHPDAPVTIGTPYGDYARITHVDIAAADEGECVYIECDDEIAGDPTPWCLHCGARENCDCVIADNH